MRTYRVTNAVPLGNYEIRITFSDGHSFDLDLQPMLNEKPSQLEAPLHDLGYFAEVTVNGLTIEWPNGFDICPDELRRWSEAGSVLVTPPQVGAR